MKRDMDLVRKILFQIEEHDDPNESIRINSTDHSENEIHYHLQILRESELIRAIDASTQQDTYFIPTRLTWKGHEFLDDIRSDTVWRKTKETVGSRVGSVSLAVIQEVAKATTKTLLGLP